MKKHNKLIKTDESQINQSSVNLTCTCNGKPCAGICREQHLFRKRQSGVNRCPSAFVQAVKVKSKKTKSEEEREYDEWQ